VVSVVPWYFAYGRNVSIERLRDRIERAPPLICRGILPGYRLAFNKAPGPKESAGYANIVPTAAEWVEGVLYLVSEEDLSRLDEYEGVPRHYRRSAVTVWNVDQARWVNAIAYVAVATDDSLRPPRDYLEEIVASAREVGLSPEWLSRLEALLKEACS